MASIECYRNTDRMTTTLKTEIPDYGYFIDGQLISEIAKIFAKRYVEENYQRLAAEMNPVAIANMSIAQAAAAVRTTLEKKLPDKIMEVHHYGSRW